MNLPYLYKATLVRVIDGDTVVLSIDLGFKVTFQLNARLYGINAPEVHGTTRDAGLAAAAYLRTLLASSSVLLVESKAIDKFAGRYDMVYDMVLSTQAADGALVNINNAMVASGHAVPYTP